MCARVYTRSNYIKECHSTHLSSSSSMCSVSDIIAAVSSASSCVFRSNDGVDPVDGVFRGGGGGGASVSTELLRATGMPGFAFETSCVRTST
jgi:hypothetical protein